MKPIRKVFSTLAFGALLSGVPLNSAPPNADVKREEQYSDRLRKAQREYVQIMEEFDRWCSSHGQRVGAKGAPGDLGCVASATPTSTPATPPAKP